MLRSPWRAAAQPADRPLHRQGRCASLRDGLRPPLTAEPLPVLRAAVAGQARSLPAPDARPSGGVAPFGAVVIGVPLPMHSLRGCGGMTVS